MSTQKTEIVTFGCRLNLYESAVIKENVEKAGLTDAIIFNTCAVTQEAERQARQAIRKARREHPHKKIIVTGCSAQISPDMYSKMPEVDQVLGNDVKLQVASFAPENTEPVLVNDIFAVKTTAGHLIAGFDEQTRAYLQVQNGCDHRCTFCQIPFGRGNSQSVAMGPLFEQVAHYVAQGVKEVVLTGVDITSYGQDLPGQPKLGQMARRLLATMRDLPRLRLSSVDPVEVDEDIFWLLANEPRFMPHLHISLQAGDDLILKRMKRRHLRQDILDFCAKVRSLRPDAVFGADIIAGFPTETEEHFLNTFHILDEAGLTHVHVFPYSPHVGTPAARMPQVDKATIKARAKKLRDHTALRLEAYLRQCVGQEVEVLVERGEMGLTPHFVPVQVGPGPKVGSLVRVKVEEYRDQKLWGRVL